MHAMPRAAIGAAAGLALRGAPMRLRSSGDFSDCVFVSRWPASAPRCVECGDVLIQLRAYCAARMRRLAVTKFAMQMASIVAFSRVVHQG
jgi:hypothetical protein